MSRKKNSKHYKLQKEHEKVTHFGLNTTEAFIKKDLEEKN